MICRLNFCLTCYVKVVPQFADHFTDVSFFASWIGRFFFSLNKTFGHVWKVENFQKCVESMKQMSRIWSKCVKNDVNPREVQSGWIPLWYKFSSIVDVPWAVSGREASVAVWKVRKVISGRLLRFDRLPLWETSGICLEFCWNWNLSFLDR